MNYEESDKFVNEVRAAVKKYESDGIMPVLPEGTTRFDVWRCAFQDHLEVWKMVAIAENKDLIKKSIEGSDGSEPYLNISGMLASAHMERFTEYGLEQCGFVDLELKQKWAEMFSVLYQEVKNLWFTAFGDKPAFIDSLARRGMKEEMK